MSSSFDWFSIGGMMEMSSSSPAPNGYPHRASPCPSPGAMVNRQSRQSPPSRGPPMGRPMMGNSHNGLVSPDLQVITLSLSLNITGNYNSVTLHVITPHYIITLSSHYRYLYLTNIIGNYTSLALLVITTPIYYW